MERKIGEIFEYKGKWHQCVIPTNGCDGCSFRRPNCCVSKIKCFAHQRSDHKSVIFKKLEKVGEPYTVYDGVLLQPYRIFEKLYINQEVNKNYIVQGDREKNLVAIEIKQNKEDMEEEREYDENHPRFKNHKNIKQVINMRKMKPFSLEAARAGKPVCTRDGRKARIIAADLNNKTYPLAAVIENNGEENEVHNYTSDGLATYGTLNDADLMMLPEKKEGWINIDYNCNTKKVTVEDEVIYPTKEEALKNVCSQTHKATVKIEWEE